MAAFPADGPSFTALEALLISAVVKLQVFNQYEQQKKKWYLVIENWRHFIHRLAEP